MHWFCRIAGWVCLIAGSVRVAGLVRVSAGFVCVLGAFPLLGQSAEDLNNRFREAAQQQAEGELDSAEAAYLDILADTEDPAPDVLMLRAITHRSLAEIAAMRGDADQSREWQLLGIAVLEAHPEVPRAPIELGVAYRDLHAVEATTGDLDLAKTYLDKGVAWLDGACEGQPPQMAGFCDRMTADMQGLHGVVLYQRQSFTEAEPYLEAVAAYPDGAVRPEVLTAVLAAYGNLLNSQARFQESRAIGERLQALRQQLQP